ncbi:guanylate kinase [Neisseria wadsworthii]|uniref:Guanylate kinase n=1 Tax=Neisseria wadsworthii 9715 TaxID=1030841 RepID=G4CPW0_9NEIS|nr:guanylate kinase [Neisseria wadsworthii]EGZ47275.1 guanylate kinase [Neisseria wadsworthii 9715]QMT34902.1 guanylate kinase [Neisseria wadsworthii]
MRTPQKGNIFIISAASGTGKTTLVSRLLNRNKDICASVSHTTRQPREGEIDGKHYHFVNISQFEHLINQSAFLEYANVFGNYYGTSQESVEQLQNQGYDVILEIDVQGAEQIRRALPESISIFLLPPSFQSLSDRLRGRKTDSEEVIDKRLSEARNEIEQSLLFDYLVVNDNLDEAENNLLHIIKSNRLKQSNQKQFIENLLENS